VRVTRLSGVDAEDPVSGAQPGAPRPSPGSVNFAAVLAGIVTLPLPAPPGGSESLYVGHSARGLVKREPEHRRDGKNGTHSTPGMRAAFAGQSALSFQVLCCPTRRKPR
jgi:hypothetical protein